MVALNTFNNKAALTKTAVAAAEASTSADFMPVETKVTLAARGVVATVKNDPTATTTLTATADSTVPLASALSVKTKISTTLNLSNVRVGGLSSDARIAMTGDVQAAVINANGGNTGSQQPNYNMQLAAMRYGYLASGAEISRMNQLGVRQWLSSQLATSGTVMDFGQGVVSYDERLRYFHDLETRSGGLQDDRYQELRNLWINDGIQYYNQLCNTQRPFLHRYVQFLMNHFSISFGISDTDRVAIKMALQAHSYFAHIMASGVTGKFKDLLNVTARFPAMLLSLSGQYSESGWNALENYPRELMELHTVGPLDDNGQQTYTQTDVRAMARLLTGMRYHTDKNTSPDSRGRIGGRYYFDSTKHDPGAKNFPFLGINMAAYPAAEGDQKITEILNALGSHPLTARKFARKLVAHFVSDDPNWAPGVAMATRIANVFMSTDGDLMAVARQLITDLNALHPSQAKAPRPDQILIGMVRAGGLVVNTDPAYTNLLRNIMLNYLPAMNMPHWQAPDVRGFLVDNARWVNDASIMVILDHVSMLANQVSAKIPALRFYNNTIGAMASSTFMRSSSAQIANFAATEPVNAIICTMMSKEFLKNI